MTRLSSFLNRCPSSFFSGLASGVWRPVSLFTVRRPASSSGCRPSSVVCRLASGFTLIEVLVAMTVLAVMVLMVANIFQSSSASWNIGTQKADMNTAARAALDYMARELACAVAGPIEKADSGGAQYLTFRQEKIDDIRFLALANDPNASGNERAVRGVFFWHKNTENILMVDREVKTPSPLNCYVSPGWSDAPSGGSMLITNVLSLQFYVYTNESDLASGTPAPNITHDQLPLCVDIALTMLSDDDMRRYNQLSVPADKTAFSDRNSKLYSTRVYFPNRVGYGGR